MKYKAYLSLGSNIGNREEFLIKAIREISKLGEDLKFSNVYETDPVGFINQDSFLNVAVSIYTDLSPQLLLEELHKIENNLNRIRTIQWGPRTIDIDILLYGCLSLDLPMLKIPHPLMFERAFVLIPLKEIFIEKELFEFNFNDMINRCSDKEGVKYYKKLDI
ncbi:UNVERIFIED_CONTAM: 2-amino-4-hydroxy-6-hydroxymethyldihydropteridine diphosphokinase [Acetivibrio alkalicellulosi]